MWIDKISFCLLLWQSITLVSSALNTTQAVRLCLFCDHRNYSNKPQAKHIFPDIFHFPWLSPDHCQIPPLFQVFQVGGRPEQSFAIWLYGSGNYASPCRCKQNRWRTNRIEDEDGAEETDNIVVRITWQTIQRQQVWWSSRLSSHVNSRCFTDGTQVFSRRRAKQTDYHIQLKHATSFTTNTQSK